MGQQEGQELPDGQDALRGQEHGGWTEVPGEEARHHQAALRTDLVPAHQPSWMSSTRDMFGVDQVEVRAWHQVGKELKIETNVGEMKLTVRRTPDNFVEFIRMGETMLKSKTDVTPATFTTTIDTLFYLPSNSMLSKVFCMYGKGCFNKRQGHMKVVVDRVNKNAFMNKFSVESTVHKDDRMALEMSVNTM